MSTSDCKGPNLHERLGRRHYHPVLVVANPIQASIGNLIHFVEPQTFISLSIPLPNCWSKQRLKNIWRPPRSRWQNPVASLIYWVYFLHINRKIASHSSISENIPGSQPVEGTHEALRKARRDIDQSCLARYSVLLMSGIIINTA